MLKTLVETICKNIRTMDVVARYGGDEFVLVLPETGVENAERVMKRIVEALKEKNISISYGMLEISEFETIGDVYKEVDKRMYGMKKSKTNNT
ncbi:GGDEF domain-containing protein [Fervidobacterium pennivorans subsp. shakshaketiis]|uniref:GGDEF domain-containing protein n=1 Tax=Fervidobacterium pennivorans TaxID=93466 RepID=UPI00355B5001